MKSWDYRRDGLFNRCMSEQRWHLWLSRAYEHCREILLEPMREDWEPPQLERDRERLSRNATAVQERSEVSTSANTDPG